MCTIIMSYQIPMYGYEYLFFLNQCNPNIYFKYKSRIIFCLFVYCVNKNMYITNMNIKAGEYYFKTIQIMIERLKLIYSYILYLQVMQMHIRQIIQLWEYFI